MKKRILTGDRPTGKLHLGHYVGSLKNRIKLQDEYECFFIIADLHTLTTQPEKTQQLKKNIAEVVLDYLSVGIDPEISTIYLQSQIPEVGELAVILGMLTTVPRLERDPSIKDMARDFGISQTPFGLLGYPVLQAADILMVRANLVPVGKENVPHLEIVREIAQKFNRLYGQVFPIPEILVGEIGTLPGIDNRKMSKSLGNVINLSDSTTIVRQQVMKMYTDPARIHATVPGDTKNNPVFIYLRTFGQKHHQEKISDLTKRYEKGGVGDVEVKEFLFEVLEEFLTPIRAKRAEFEKQPEIIGKILKVGTEKARAEAQKTLELVRKAMGIDFHFT